MASGGLIDPALYAFDGRALPSFVAALVIAATAVLIVRWERGTRVSWMLAGFSALFVLWALGRGLQRMALEPLAMVELARLVYALVAIVVPLLYQFVCVVLHKERQRTGSIILAWTIGGALALMATGTPWVVNGWYAYAWGMEPSLGPMGIALMLGIALLIGVSCLDVYHAWRRSHPGSTDRRRTALFAIGLLTLYVTPLDYAAGLGYPVYPVYGALSISVFTLVTAFVTWRYGLVEVTAQVVAEEISGLLRGALLVLDRDGIVQFANEASSQTLGLRREALVGRSARALLGEAFAPPNLALLGRMRGSHVEKEIVHRGADGATRTLAFSVVSARDAHDRDFAYVCLLRDVTEQKRADQQRIAEGYTDALTGLPNRSLFLSLLDTALRKARETQLPPPAVCFLGLDRLRVINEDLGYSIGDRVLVEVAARLQRETGRDETVARVGGDEFGVLIEHSAGADEVASLAQRLNTAIHQPLGIGEHTVYLSASIGVAHGTRESRSGSDLLGSASAAMYRVKAAGGDGIDTVTAGEFGSQRIRLEADLRRALEAREFKTWYQPIVDLEECRVTGFEALLRWQHPTRGLLLPGAFLDFAEEVGLMAAIGRQVLEMACADLRRLRTALGDTRLCMSVNLSEDELREPDLVERTLRLLSLNELAPSSLRFELLERVALVAPVHQVLDQLARAGIGLYVDDFGTGYSALSRLHELPVTTLKVDREFVRAMSIDEGGDKIVAGIIALARSLGLGVIAEGAGLPGEAQRLRELGCRELQGFYFSEALPFDAAVAFARNRQALAQKIAAAEPRRTAAAR